jgi:succinate dehydrogenase/fumarate reductase iron-sulfur protein
MPESYKITITRFDASYDIQPYEKSYTVPDDPQSAPMTALKALHWIDRYEEPIAYDFNCRSGTCGRCSIMIDGLPRLACYFILTGNHSFAPLTGFPVIRDLVVNKKEVYSRFVQSNHNIKTKGPHQVLQPIDGKFWRDTIFPLNACRECMCCYASCESLNDFKRWNRYAGPGVMQQIYLRHIDGQDQSNRLEQAVYSGVFECMQCGNCTTVCPALIPAAENIKSMMDEAEAAGLKPSTERTSYWPLL